MTSVVENSFKREIENVQQLENLKLSPLKMYKYLISFLWVLCVYIRKYLVKF